jgi:hypothetical protein
MKYISITALALALSLPAIASGQQITPVPLHATGSSTVFDINKNGDVVGNWDAAPDAAGFFYSSRAGVIVLRVPGATYTTMTGMNDRGQIVGNFTGADGRQHGYVWSAADDFRTIDPPGSKETGLTAIGNDGTLMGYYKTDEEPSHEYGFVMRGDQVEIIFASWEADITIPMGMADDGTIVGFTQRMAHPDESAISSSGYIFESFSLHNFVYRKLAPAGVPVTEALGISPDGTTVVGLSLDPDGERGWILRDGRFERLGVLVVPFAVNNSGLMGGFAQLDPSSTHTDAVYIGPIGRVRIDTPNTASRWGIGTHQRLAWSYDGTATQFQIDVSRDRGATWEPIAAVDNKAGTSQSYYWTVTGTPTGAGRLRVSAIGDPTDPSDINDANIRIEKARIELFTPVAGSQYDFGGSYVISFKHDLGAQSPIAVDVSGDGGHSWRTIAQTVTRGSDSSTFNWTVDLTPTTSARIRIRALDGSGAVATSPLFKVTSGTAGMVAPTVSSR